MRRIVSVLMVFCACGLAFLACRDNEARSVSWELLRPANTGSDSGPCSWHIEHAEGDRSDWVGDSSGVRIEDVTAVARNRAGVAVLSSSPIYGKPGIWLVGVDHCDVRHIVAGTHRSDAYPEGADYFELAEVTEDSKGLLIRYWYAPDVDAIQSITARKGMVLRDTLLATVSN